MVALKPKKSYMVVLIPVYARNEDDYDNFETLSDPVAFKKAIAEAREKDGFLLINGGMVNLNHYRSAMIREYTQE